MARYWRSLCHLYLMDNRLSRSFFCRWWQIARYVNLLIQLKVSGRLITPLDKSFFRRAEFFDGQTRFRHDWWTIFRYLAYNVCWCSLPSNGRDTYSLPWIKVSSRYRVCAGPNFWDFENDLRKNSTRVESRRTPRAAVTSTSRALEENALRSTTTLSKEKVTIITIFWILNYTFL